MYRFELSTGHIVFCVFVSTKSLFGKKYLRKYSIVYAVLFFYLFSIIHFQSFCYFYFHMLAFTSSHSLGNILVSSKLYATYIVFSCLRSFFFSQTAIYFVDKSRQNMWIKNEKKNTFCLSFL